jgi:tetratricopeptide (TPR) repeat protein
MDNARIEDLKRRIQRDPASIAFAQLGEEYRRAGRSREAIETCRAGLSRHPGYLSARVTLGRALLDVGELDEAERELKEVLRVAPENLAALRGLAETMLRRGDRISALAHYQAALALAPRDIDLQNRVASLGEELRRAASSPGRPASASEPPAAPDRPVTPASVADRARARPEAAAMPAAIEQADREALRALPALERWLEAILHDRERRLTQH